MDDQDKFGICGLNFNPPLISFHKTPQILQISVSIYRYDLEVLKTKREGALVFYSIDSITQVSPDKGNKDQTSY